MTQALWGRACTLGGADRPLPSVSTYHPNVTYDWDMSNSTGKWAPGWNDSPVHRQMPFGAVILFERRACTWRRSGTKTRTHSVDLKKDEKISVVWQRVSSAIWIVRQWCCTTIPKRIRWNFQTLEGWCPSHIILLACRVCETWFKFGAAAQYHGFHQASTYGVKWEWIEAKIFNPWLAVINFASQGSYSFWISPNLKGVEQDW